MEFPFPVNCDPALVLEFLASMSCDEQAEFMENSSYESDETEEQTRPLNTQEAMVHRFKTMRARFVRPGGILGESSLAGNLATGSFTIDDFNPPSEARSLHTLKPMIGKELELGTTHRGQYLCGWVAIDDAFFGIASSSLLLEDVTGHLVEIAAYGLVDIELPPLERQQLLASRFPKGRPIAVIEPYYKVRLDGSEGIRVEEAKEIIPWRDVPTNLMTWKKLGNEFFSVVNSQNKGRGALACYQRAVKAAQPEVHALAMLLNNIAACRFKRDDYGTSIQLSGAAVHLDPTYFKGWFQLASALAEQETQARKEGKECSSVSSRVVLKARSVLPKLSTKELQVLENMAKTDALPNTTANYPQFHSYAEWCVVLGTLGVVLTDEDLGDVTRTACAWRTAGSNYFAKGDFEAAERNYRKGVATVATCCCNLSIVLNNIAAVHLVLNRGTQDTNVGGICGLSAKSDEVPNIEAALLNCTVAGILDSLNYKAWLRRARCLKDLGFSQEKCIKELQEVCTSIVLKSIVTNERLKECKRNLDVDIQRRLKQSTGSKTGSAVPVMSTETQPKQSDERLSSVSENFAEGGVLLGIQSEQDVDRCIARLDGFVKRMHVAYSAAKSQPSRLQQLPREFLMLIRNPPPSVHTEFPRLRGWPDGIDGAFAHKVLYRAFLYASINPWNSASSMRSGTFWGNLTFEDMVKRWNGTGGLEILRARGAVKLGEIVDGREVLRNFVPRYEARIRLNFANNPSRTEVYYFGSTHVAIGFNDFSGLLAAEFCKKSSSNAPLKFVGFEMSEFAVAKCKVVAQMLASPSVSISSVTEVWLSSTWSKTTVKEFRDSVNVVLESLRDQSENTKVMAYLSHWASAETISAAKARSDFFTNLEKRSKHAFPSLFSFRREIDRLDLAQYMLSGEIRASADVMKIVEKEQPRTANTGANTFAAHSTPTGNLAPKKKKTRNQMKNKKHNKTAGRSKAATSLTSLVGSLTMWNVPPGSPPLEGDVAFNTVDFMALLDDYVEREMKQKRSTDRLSVVDLFVIHIMTNLHRIREMMLTNQLTFEVHYGVVKAVRGEAASDLESRQLLERIALMRPDTISWTNVLDYFLPEDFHDIARRCSMYGGCVHYGYSMNWPTQVAGASIIDLDPVSHKPVIDSLLDSALGFSNTSVFAVPSTVAMFKQVKLDKLLFLPFREDPLNSTAFVLANLFNDEWVEHFFKKGNLSIRAKQRLGAYCTPSNCGLQKGAMDLAVPSPLYRSSLTLHMSWCYDPNVRLVAANNPFEVSGAAEAEMFAQMMGHLGL